MRLYLLAAPEGAAFTFEYGPSAPPILKIRDAPNRPKTNDRWTYMHEKRAAMAQGNEFVTALLQTPSTTVEYLILFAPGEQHGRYAAPAAALLVEGPANGLPDFARRHSPISGTVLAADDAKRTARIAREGEEQLGHHVAETGRKQNVRRSAS
jgi:hypothetical protein